jgi:hypothetical protein
MLAGGVVPVLVAGLLDAITWSYPFQTIWLNFWVNVVLKASAFWGTEPWYRIAVYPVLYWGGAVGVIGLGALWGARRLPLLLIVAATILLTHALVPHKEYRFIYPALPLILTLAGLASAELVGRMRTTGWMPAAAVAIGFWIVTTVAVGVAIPERSMWLAHRGELAAFDMISRADDACGIGLYDVDIWFTPGQSGLRRAVPLYDVSARDLAARAPAFNRLLAYGGTPIPDQSFTDATCFDDGMDARGVPRPPFCVWRRAGGCVPNGRPGPAPLWPPQLEDWRPAPAG